MNPFLDPDVAAGVIVRTGFRSGDFRFHVFQVAEVGNVENLGEKMAITGRGKGNCLR